MGTGKKLLAYAAFYKRTIALALLLLSLAVFCELTGPMIAKKLIDDHILGIERIWLEVPPAASDDAAVQFRGHTYKRIDRLQDGEAHGEEARVLLIGRSYYFIAGAIRFDGVREAGDETVRITRGGEHADYKAVRLTGSEVVAFYKPELPGLLRLMAAFAGLLLLASGFHYGEKRLLQTAAGRIIQQLRLDVYGHIQRLPVRFFDNQPAGKIVARITNDTEAIRELFVNVLANFASSAIYMTAILAAMFLLDVRLALVCLLIIPILFVWVAGYRKLANRYNHVIRSRLSDMNGMLNETIQGMRIIRAFRRQEQVEREFEALNREHFSYQYRMLGLNSLTSHNLVGFLRVGAYALLIWYFSRAAGIAGSAESGALSLGVLYAFVDYLNRLFQPVTNVVNQLSGLSQSMVSAERVFDLLAERVEDGQEQGADPVAEGHGPARRSVELDRKAGAPHAGSAAAGAGPVTAESAAEGDSDRAPAATAGSGRRSHRQGRGHVRFEDVSFAYKEGEPVLKRISFEAKPGETVAFVGHTGSGKSSLMNLLFRFYDPQQGTIWIDGQNTRKMTRQHVRSHMGIVLQDPFLFTGTVAGNVSLDDRSVARERVEAALEAVGAGRLLGSLPYGYDEPVEEKGATLSAGQRQLISFARALAFDPAILVLDEATASIDTETESVIQQALDVLKRGRTTFIIAHRLSTIRQADQIIVLHRGEIAESGTHEQLMRRRGPYYRLYRLQQGAYV
ncbi:ABC transporter ATP-binding protein [Paenibacillus hamazuiensis]|uniref:ABC transporter ATP-binding protein n=1 Tax=Paenibacillus hamazuiensis TaxID=2936508 RepID=UPI0023DF6287|nr:ABC transporter ATP-binding protein [Paenibacillus hamazuiensis]